MIDAIEHIARHVIGTSFTDLPENAVAASQKFILDSIGVGIAGGRDPWAAKLVSAQQPAAGADAARILGRHEVLDARSAALCNAYQIHNAEFDCVHEPAVVHPVTVVLAASLAEIDRVRSATGKAISGKQLIRAVALGVDVACHLGVASASPLKFFRPGTCGAFGATAAIATLRSFEIDQLVNAFGIVHSQLCGTMQAHTEGSPLLALQMGFNARNALTACDFADQGIPGTRQTLQGPFGFFALFEGEHNIDAVLPQLGKIWRITEVAHKPFPSGRATHGIVDACLTLREQNTLSAREIRQVRARVPPLTYHLVGRPVMAEMDTNYARLCARFVAARALIAGNVTSEDFDSEGLRDSNALELAQRIEIAADNNPDPNALSPIELEIEYCDDQLALIKIETVYGHPDKPMSRAGWLEKFRRNWRRSAVQLSDEVCESVIAQIDSLPSVDDAATLIDKLVP